MIILLAQISIIIAVCAAGWWYMASTPLDSGFIRIMTAAVATLLALCALSWWWT